MVAPRQRPARKTSAIDQLDAGISADARAVKGPDVTTFRDFLEKCARVPVGGGENGPYTFEGREALLEVVETIDLVLGTETGKPLADADIALAGGAQFGKSILELNLGAFLTGVRFQSWGLYLPDNDLVEGMIDTKFRPDVLDQLPWFSEMTKVGRAVNKSGKAVNRKGAFTVTDGIRKSQGMVIGLNKVPTSFSFDVTTLDEVDDIKPKMEKFVRGRMTSSAQRLTLLVGTQRVAGRGMNKAWKDRSQGVKMHRCPSCSHELNLEESFPQCVRVALDGKPRRDDPQFQLTADFRRSADGEVLATHDPTNRYYYACTKCGAELDRTRKGFRWVHRRPEQIKQRRWSFRITQLGIAAIDVSQIVAHWTRAVVDPEEMVAFRCDRLGLPESTEQKITPLILDRARKAEAYDLAGRVRQGCRAFGGLDTGRRCWFFSREVQAPDVKRVLHVEQIAVGNVVRRAVDLFHLGGLECLFIDQAPETDAARTIALKLNGLEGLREWPRVPTESDAHFTLPGGLTWNGKRGRWENLRCAVVTFSKRGIGAGITHAFDQFDKDGHKMFVPLIQCNRFEAIDAVVREFLTPAENVVQFIRPKSGQPYIRQQPSMRLPRRAAGSPLILETLDTHLLVGSEREETTAGEPGDYIDKAENHLLLADAYSCLAETEGGTSKPTPFAFSNPSAGRHGSAARGPRARSPLI
jgi:hypothetical protein